MHERQLRAAGRSAPDVLVSVKAPATCAGLVRPPESVTVRTRDLIVALVAFSATRSMTSPTFRLAIAPFIRAAAPSFTVPVAARNDTLLASLAASQMRRPAIDRQGSPAADRACQLENAAMRFNQTMPGFAHGPFTGARSDQGAARADADDAGLGGQSRADGYGADRRIRACSCRRSRSVSRP